MRVRIHEARKLAVIPHDERVAQLIPHARVITKNERRFHLVPAKRDELQLLRNLGYETPTPLSVDYDWAGNVPFEAQVATTDLLIHSQRAYVLSSMGTGKTLSALFAIDYLMQHGHANKALVVAPLSTLTTVWDREIFERMSHRSATVLYGTRAKRKKLLDSDSDIYIINHDGAKTIFKDLMARTDIDIVVIDELAVFRNRTTDRWKTLNALVRSRKYVWGMTGSPTPKEPADAYAQVRLLTPQRVPKYYKQFKEQTMHQVSQFKWLPKHDANDTVFAAMQPSVRFTLDQCTDIPPTTYSTREVELSKQQKILYDEMLKRCYASYQSEELMAVNEGVKLSKLLQITCGHVYTREGRIASVPAPKRESELMNILEQADNKVLVFVPFKHAVDHILTVVEKDYKAAKVYGDTPVKERNEIFNQFQFGNGLDVIVAHPQCMAHGLTLTAADTIVWYSPPMSLEIYEQANARIPRPGQKNHTHIIHIESCAVERRVYNRLQKRANAQGTLLEMFKEQSNDMRKAI